MHNYINEFSDRYYCNKEGFFVSIKTNKAVTIHIDDNGYGYYKITDNTGKRRKVFIHRIMAIQHLPLGDKHCITTMIVNHKDGNRFNNSIENLEWVTQQKNIVHKFKTGYVHIRALNKYDKKEILFAHHYGMSIRNLATKYNVSYNAMKLFIRRNKEKIQ